MLRKSRVIAMLSVCVMMFAVVQPAFAWWGEDTAYGGVVGGATGGFWGGVIGAVIAGAAVVATGGLAAIPLAGAAIGGAALTGATYGAAGGAVVGAGVGAITDKETVNTTAKVASVGAAVVTVGAGALPFVGAAVTGTATVGAGVEAVKSAVGSGVRTAVSTAVDEFKKAPIEYTFGVATSGYSAVRGVAALPQIIEKFNSRKLENKLQHLEDLAKDGKKVTVLEVKQITPSRLAIKYTVNGVEYSETFDNK